MGIRGLNTCLQTSATSSIKNVDWSSFSSKRIGVDIQCFLYRAIANQLCPLTVIAEQIVKFRQNNITPIYVFDGKPPVEKDTVIIKRRTDRNAALELCKKLRQDLEKTTDSILKESLLKQIQDLESKNPSISFESKNEIKKFMYTVGVLFVNATSEADSLLAYLFKRGIIDAVATFDLDLLPRGTNVMVPKNIKNSPGTAWSYYDYSVIKRSLCLNDSQFVELCVLMGSDYTPDLAIVPWSTALNSIRSGISLRNIWERHTFSSWRRVDTVNTTDIDMKKLLRAKNLLLGIDDVLETLLEPDQIAKIAKVELNNEEDSFVEFKKLYSTWDNDWWHWLGMK